MRSSAIPAGGDAGWPTGTLLHRLPAPTVRALLTLGVEFRVLPGRILIREGAQDSHVFLIERGIAKVTAHASDGRATLLSIRVAGDLVGEMSALGTAPRSATVTMCGTGRVRLIHGRDFQPFLRSHPEAAINLAAMVGDRLRWSNQRRIDFGAYPVKGRLARILAEVASAHGNPGPAGVEIGVRLTQPELATMCGAAEISVQKALRELRQDGLLDTGYGRITVRDLAALRSSVEQ